MQAVADALGVDPKAINYHVGDRAGLQELVVLDVFEQQLGRLDLSATDWHTVVHTYAVAVRDATVELGVLALIAHLPGAAAYGALARVEAVLQALVDAGCEPAEAGAVVTLVTETAFSAGVAGVRADHHRLHPDLPAVADAVNGAAAEDFPVLRQVVAAGQQGDGETDQLEYNLALILAGLEHILAGRRR